MKYRPEIDGIRALAILPVMLFHAGFNLLPGGYVGVDVFFVISGFLITTILVNDMDSGRYSLIDFYDRRIRRIFPALIVVLIVTSLLAVWLMLPSDMDAYLKSLMLTVGFSSNIGFWMESGYFDSDSELKPLLHTWSLAVEEQYYVFFPLVLLFIFRLSGRKYLSGIILVGILGSLIFSHWLIQRAPSATFFLLPGRAWELLAGAYLAVNIDKIRNFPCRVVALLRWIGVVLVVGTMLIYNNQILFPGLAAIPPVIGTVLLIGCVSSADIIGKLLSSRFMVSVGLISYSLYLWHQPVFAFARYYYNAEPPVLVMCEFFIITVVAAYLSWKYIELPFRDRKRFSRKYVFSRSAGLSVGVVGLAGLALTVPMHEKLWNRMHDEVQIKTYNLYKDITDLKINRDNEDCIFNVWEINELVVNRLNDCYQKYGPGIAISGDSHSVNTFDMFKSVYTGYPFVFGTTKGGCRVQDMGSECPYLEFVKLMESDPDIFEVVIFEQAGYQLFRPEGMLHERAVFNRVQAEGSMGMLSIDFNAIDLVLDYLELFSEKTKVVWYGPRIEPHFSINYIVNKGCDYSFKLRRGQEENFLRLEREIKNKIYERKSILYHSQMEIFSFDPKKDIVSCDFIYWRDGDHLTLEGIKNFGERSLSDEKTALWLDELLLR
ncbi:acyltransferase [Oceanobacter sp. 5_MG-2023]|uniref:acyltransferase family protein n=1 Tax=Oceanobacter sp. 5_MG-2023 TaxID=3062645 RepID=UPI0026E33AC6|nr:acyltransferase [Oceanobacter sp. 5_MG-2023]MDO6681334.1 acyltransferase [Oceanobacter sp. 5_MG-2023]